MRVCNGICVRVCNGVYISVQIVLNKVSSIHPVIKKLYASRDYELKE